MYMDCCIKFSNFYTEFKNVYRYTNDTQIKHISNPTKTGIIINSKTS